MAANLLQPFNPALSLFRRCVQCGDKVPPCPSCRSGEVCIITVPDCNNCPRATCVSAAASGSTNPNSDLPSRGPNVAAIAGGVIGGIIGVAIIVFFIWKFWLKGRRREIEEYQWEEEEEDVVHELPPEKLSVPGSFIQMRDARSSTHSVSSLASTVLTRASNIIQIAYIPGVTNRGTNSPGLLVPPVPPIPIATTPSTVNSPFDGEQRFFVPDLRDSTYSDNSSITTDPRPRKSIASSLARSSIGTTIYKDDAVAHPMPATTIVRGNAKVVSVKSGVSGYPAGPAGDSPVSERADFSRQASAASTATSRPVIVKMLGSSDTLRASPLGSQKSGAGSVTGKSVKPVALNIMRKGSKGPSSAPSESGDASPATSADSSQRHLSTVHSRPHTNISIADSVATDLSVPHARARASVARSHVSEADEVSDDDEEAHERSRQSLLKSRDGASRLKEARSPFGDEAAVVVVDNGRDRMGSASAGSRHREESPFTDEHAV